MKKSFNFGSIKKITAITILFLSLFVYSSPTLHADTNSCGSQTVKTSTQTFSFSGDPSQVWHFSLNYFNPSLGTLTSVKINQSVSVTTTQKAENLNIDDPSTVYGEINGTTTASILGNNSQLNFQNISGPSSLSVFDGVLDYSGTSGITLGPSTVTKQAPDIMITNQSDLPNFTSTNSSGIDFTETSVASAWFTGTGGQVNSSDITSVSGSVTVTYTYTAQCAGNTPPTISLLGDNPFNLVVGMTFPDPEAKATDLEDGNFATSSIVVSSTVNTNVIGAYSVTYSVTDSGGLSTSTARVVNVVPVPPPVCTGNCGGGGGGGGGGNGPIVGSIATSTNTVATTTTSVITTTQVTAPAACYYLYDYLRQDFNNNPVEVKKLQMFLNVFEGESLNVNGIYDDATVSAVDTFQNKYKDEVLTPWGETAPTGYTYILTKKKVNEIYCSKPFPVTFDQQTEIDSYRNANTGVGGGVNTQENLENTATTTVGQVGEAEQTQEVFVVGTTSTSTDNQTTLAGVSPVTQGIASRMTANVISSGKQLRDLAVAFFAWPFGNMFSNPTVNWCANSFAGGWFTWLLLLIIIIISILWYREYRNNRKIENINKEIDLN